jgi:holliday junction DNA helicase RuvA
MQITRDLAMFSFIKGTLVEIETNKAIIEAAGVGYLIFIPVSAYTSLPPVGSLVTLHTSFIVREDAQILYGFLNKEERTLFETLISISGIGPKTALSILGHLDMEAFGRAIQNNNFSIICKVPGVGKKTAERLIVELKDKNIFKNFSFKGKGGDRIADAIQALITLGYNPIQAQKAVKESVTENLEDTASLIKSALRKI